MYRSVDDLKNACDHRKMKIYYQHFSFDLRMINRIKINCRIDNYVYRLNGSLTAWWLIKNRHFEQ